jgi:hypothetical protein
MLEDRQVSKVEKVDRVQACPHNGCLRSDRPARTFMSSILEIIDPSGIDMSRDIKSRLELFTEGAVHVQRIALNMAQIEKFNPPPNPAKLSDPRAADYVKRFGDESWELDALEPAILVDRISRAVLQFRDEARWAEAIEEENKGLRTLQSLRDHFGDVVLFLRDFEATEHP